jgi:hypothetical protein
MLTATPSSRSTNPACCSPAHDPDIDTVGKELDALLVGLIELLGGEVPNQLRDHVN